MSFGRRRRLLAPAVLRETEARATRGALDSRCLHARLRAAVRQVLRRYRSLSPVRVRLSR